MTPSCDRLAPSSIFLSPPPPHLQVFRDHKTLLDSGVCDVVIVATPNMTHFSILLDVLSHPRSHHVLVEKPLCINVEQCEQVKGGQIWQSQLSRHVQFFSK